MSGHSVWEAMKAIAAEREAKGDPPTALEIEIREGRAWWQQPLGEGEWRPLGSETEAEVAEMYERASGVVGWKAARTGKTFELTPPIGYVIVTDESGTQRLVKIRQVGISIREVAE